MPALPTATRSPGPSDWPMSRSTGMAVLCDTDMAVLEDPRRLNLPPGAVAGKLVDAPVPPLDVIRNIFVAAGLNPPPTVPLPWGPDDWTISGNNNGGLYMIPGPLLPRVATAWAHWATWLLDRAELLAEWTVYVDQVAMAVGPGRRGYQVAPSRRALEHPHPRSDQDPARCARAGGHPLPPRGRPPGPDPIDAASASIDRRIAAVNRAIDEVWAAGIARRPPTSKWLTMTEPPEPPPTVHADDVADDPRRLARGARAGVGTRGRPGSGVYTGCSRALGASTSRRRFAEGWTNGPTDGCARGLLADNTSRSRSHALPRPADPPDGCRRIPRPGRAGLWNSTRQALVVSGYEDPDGIRDPDVRFHEPLSATLRQCRPRRGDLSR